MSKQKVAGRGAGAAGQEQSVYFVVNEGGAVHSVGADHPAVRIARGGRRFEGQGYFRFATDEEIDLAFKLWRQERPASARSNA